ncbi:hypothetical protein NFI96_006797 [Prochilodus magdalenae]|nr:hypothetical protein NFI96_006797 [Prochilodus magdalenae]
MLVVLSHSWQHETDSTTHTSVSGSAAHPGRHISASRGKKVCCQRSVQSLEALSGDEEEAVGGQHPSSRTATSARDRRSTARALQNDLQQATDVHVRNRLREDGMRAQRPQMGFVLTAQHRAGRLAFAREHQDWQIRHRRPVLFTDESRFTLSTGDAVESDLLPAASFSMTGLAVGQ